MKKLFIILCAFVFTMRTTEISYEHAMELQQNEQFEQAIDCYESFLRCNPNHVSALFNLGHCYLALGKGQQAIDSLETITTLYPYALPALYNAAYTRKTIGMIDEAIALYKNIIAFDSSYDQAQLALGFAYLIKGDFENGWLQHEKYLKRSGKNGDLLRNLLNSNVATLHNKLIFLHPEGGLGDSLQFIRYAQRLHDMGATVVVRAQKPLLSLFSRLDYIDHLIGPTDTIPGYHAEATLMSLPAIFGDTESTFPTDIPYLYAQQELIDAWKIKLSHDMYYKVGICWQADKHNDKSRLPIARRGCPLLEFMPLNIENVSLYSLQKYDGVEELENLPTNFPLTHFYDLDENTGAFEDTAALMRNLDLIITVDTAIAHLAGALGCTVWLLLPYATDWRWIHNRTDSPWYPNMKIFKQETPFDWTSVIQNVHNELISISAST
jgi:tetratricopeptide (TPR) repeat protein